MRFSKSEKEFGSSLMLVRDRFNNWRAFLCLKNESEIDTRRFFCKKKVEILRQRRGAFDEISLMSLFIRETFSRFSS